jgi:hypothetical protein
VEESEESDESERPQPATSVTATAKRSRVRGGRGCIGYLGYCATGESCCEHQSTRLVGGVLQINPMNSFLGKPKSAVTSVRQPPAERADA